MLPPMDEQSSDRESGDQVCSSFDSRSPQSSATSIVPPRAEEWDRSLRHTGLEEFGKALECAAKATPAIYPNDNKSRYSKVYVLLISWQTGDPKLPVEGEIRNLRKVFDEVFHYEVEEFLIPNNNSHAEVSKKINAFVEVNNNSSDDLKIVYYAGHSRLSRTKELLWSTPPEMKNTKGRIVVWSGIQRSLEMAQSDVLILLDCCSSGVGNASEGNGVTELIGACSFDTEANGVGHYSFSQALATELRMLSKKPCFSVGELFQNIYTRIQYFMDQGLKNERYPAPVHLMLTQDEPFIRSVKLSVQTAKVPCQDSASRPSTKRVRFEDTHSLQQETEPAHITKKRCYLDGSSNSRMEQVIQPWIDGSYARKHLESDSPTEPPFQEDSACQTPEEPHLAKHLQHSCKCPPKDSLYPLDAPRALFAVRFREDIRAEDLRIELFREWLRSIPAATEEVCVEASFKCFSTLLLITLPLSMCSYIPQHPAIFSLGAVKSSIILPKKNERSLPHPERSSPCGSLSDRNGKGFAVAPAEFDSNSVLELQNDRLADNSDDKMRPQSPIWPGPPEYEEKHEDHPIDIQDEDRQCEYTLGFEGPVAIYVRNLLDKFPSADLELAQRLAKSNWERHLYIRSKKEPVEIESTDIGISAERSIFHDSGFGSSVPAASYYADSVASFITKAGDADSNYFRAPPMPIEAIDGKPFECFICGRIISHIKNRVDWKLHIFADIRPYVCTFSECSNILCTFPTRKEWADHESQNHREAALVDPVSSAISKDDVPYGNHSIGVRQYVQKSASIQMPRSMEQLNCPLCRTNLDSMRLYTTHVAKHMESIALTALPAEMEEVSDNDTASDERYQTRGEYGSVTSAQLSQDSTAMVEQILEPVEPQEMSRLPSQDSIRAHSQRTTHSSAANSYDQTRSSRFFHNLSQVSFPMSSASSDVTGRSNSPDNAAMYTLPQQVDTQNFDSFPFQGDDISGGNSVFHKDSTSGISSSLMTGSTYNNRFATSGDNAYLSSYLASQGSALLYNPSSINESPTQWDNNVNFLGSQRSSPILAEGLWPRMVTSTNSPLEYSPSLESLSPARYVQDFPKVADLPPHTTVNKVTKKPIEPRQPKVNSDIARNPRTAATSGTSDESLKYTWRILDVDNNAQVHPYYNASPQADGLYHCPWEGQDACQHKPEKLKCNYDKFVDFHLKPYRCKILQCENLQFSSTACLLRHEREAHAMHGHGEKPFLCTYEGCDRGVSGNGFPRHWNLRDHMRRVHNDPGPPKNNESSGAPPPSAPTRSR